MVPEYNMLGDTKINAGEGSPKLKAYRGAHPEKTWSMIQDSGTGFNQSSQGDSKMLIQV